MVLVSLETDHSAHVATSRKQDSLLPIKNKVFSLIRSTKPPISFEYCTSDTNEVRQLQVESKLHDLKTCTRMYTSYRELVGSIKRSLAKGVCVEMVLCDGAVEEFEFIKHLSEYLQLVRSGKSITCVLLQLCTHIFANLSPTSIMTMKQNSRSEHSIILLLWFLHLLEIVPFQFSISQICLYHEERVCLTTRRMSADINTYNVTNGFLIDIYHDIDFWLKHPPHTICGLSHGQESCTEYPLLQNLLLYMRVKSTHTIIEDILHHTGSYIFTSGSPPEMNASTSFTPDKNGNTTRYYNLMLLTILMRTTSTTCLQESVLKSLHHVAERGSIGSKNAIIEFLIAQLYILIGGVGKGQHVGSSDREKTWKLYCKYMAPESLLQVFRRYSKELLSCTKENRKDGAEALNRLAYLQIQSHSTKSAGLLLQLAHESAVEAIQKKNHDTMALILSLVAVVDKSLFEHTLISETGECYDMWFLMHFSPTTQIHGTSTDSENQLDNIPRCPEKSCILIRSRRDLSFMCDFLLKHGRDVCRTPIDAYCVHRLKEQIRVIESHLKQTRNDALASICQQAYKLQHEALLHYSSIRKKKKRASSVIEHEALETVIRESTYHRNHRRLSSNLTQMFLARGPHSKSQFLRLCLDQCSNQGTNSISFLEWAAFIQSLAKIGLVPMCKYHDFVACLGNSLKNHKINRLEMNVRDSIRSLIESSNEKVELKDIKISADILQHYLSKLGESLNRLSSIDSQHEKRVMNVIWNSVLLPYFEYLVQTPSPMMHARLVQKYLQDNFAQRVEFVRFYAHCLAIYHESLVPEEMAQLLAQTLCVCTLITASISIPVEVLEQMRKYATNPKCARAEAIFYLTWGAMSRDIAPQTQRLNEEVIFPGKNPTFYIPWLLHRIRKLTNIAYRENDERKELISFLVLYRDFERQKDFNICIAKAIRPQRKDEVWNLLCFDFDYGLSVFKDYFKFDSSILQDELDWIQNGIFNETMSKTILWSDLLTELFKKSCVQYPNAQIMELDTKISHMLLLCSQFFQLCSSFLCGERADANDFIFFCLKEALDQITRATSTPMLSTESRRRRSLNCGFSVLKILFPKLLLSCDVKMAALLQNWFGGRTRSDSDIIDWLGRPPWSLHWLETLMDLHHVICRSQNDYHAVYPPVLYVQWSRNHLIPDDILMQQYFHLVRGVIDCFEMAQMKSDQYTKWVHNDAVLFEESLLNAAPSNLNTVCKLRVLYWSLYATMEAKDVRDVSTRTDESIIDRFVEYIWSANILVRNTENCSFISGEDLVKLNAEWVDSVHRLGDSNYVNQNWLEFMYQRVIMHIMIKSLSHSAEGTKRFLQLYEMQDKKDGSKRTLQAVFFFFLLQFSKEQEQLTCIFRNSAVLWLHAFGLTALHLADHAVLQRECSSVVTKPENRSHWLRIVLSSIWFMWRLKELLEIILRVAAEDQVDFVNASLPAQLEIAFPSLSHLVQAVPVIPDFSTQALVY